MDHHPLLSPWNILFTQYAFLEMSFTLEQTTGECYLQDMIRGNEGSEIISKLQAIYVDDGAYFERIQAFIEKQGVYLLNGL